MGALDTTIGAVEIGISISSCLYGVMAVQAYNYYQANFKSDGFVIKFLVVWVCIIETIHTAFLWTYLYYFSVTNFGDVPKLAVAHWSLGFSVPVANFVTCTVQAFFAYRVYCISRRWPYTIISWSGSFLRLCLSLAIGVISYRVVTLPKFDSEYRWLIVLTIAVGTAVDVLNTLALCRNLWPAKAGVSKSRKMVERLMLWSIETGMLTSICNVTMLICLLTMDNTIWMCFLVFSAKLYSNSLLASLNGRLTLRSAVATTHVTMSTFDAYTNHREHDVVRLDIVHSKGEHNSGNTSVQDPGSV